MIKVVYVTSSQYKQQENKIFTDVCALKDGSLIKDQFEFQILEENIPERLKIRIEDMVTAEVIEAYNLIKIPCIVEHAGLIFDKYKNENYPGGLTKPMWNTLGERFVEETNSSNQAVIAKAVIAYCHGMDVKTFIGETPGKLATQSRGKRKFYWDTIFIPDNSGDKTYAEIIDKEGLEKKMREYSQSARAMINFLEYLRKAKPNDLWS